MHIYKKKKCVSAFAKCTTALHTYVHLYEKLTQIFWLAHKVSVQHNCLQFYSHYLRLIKSLFCYCVANQNEHLWMLFVHTVFAVVLQGCAWKCANTSARQSLLIFCFHAILAVTSVRFSCRLVGGWLIGRKISV